HGPLDRRAHLAAHRLPVCVAGALGGTLGVLLCLLGGLARSPLDLVAQIVKLLLVLTGKAGILAALPLKVEVARGTRAHRIWIVVPRERPLEAEVRPAWLPTPLEAEAVSAKRGLPGAGAALLVLAVRRASARELVACVAHVAHAMFLLKAI